MNYLNFRKPKFLAVSLAGFFIAILLLSQCSKDDDPLDREKFIGTYSVVETCGGGNDTYEIHVTASSAGDNAILIFNLYDWDETGTATIAGNSLTIASQILDGVTFTGSGTITGNTLTISFTVSAGGDSDACTAICTKL